MSSPDRDPNDSQPVAFDMCMHLFLTASKLLMSLTSHGFQAGEANSNSGLTSDWNINYADFLRGELSKAPLDQSYFRLSFGAYFVGVD